MRSQLLEILVFISDINFVILIVIIVVCCHKQILYVNIIFFVNTELRFVGGINGNKKLFL